MKKGTRLFMKRYPTAWLTALPLACLLGACGAPAAESAPVWQQQLPQTGVYMELKNCTLLSDQPVYYALSREEADKLREHPALQVEGTPVVTLQGVEADQVTLRFSENISDLYLYYDKVMPQPELDYVLTEGEDGTLQYRLDTVYNYEFVITTPQGSDEMLVISYRDGLRDAPAAQQEAE